MEHSESTDNGRTPPSPEVPEKPVRRRFTVEEKSRILDEADACTEKGQLGELLRREGIYSSYLTSWRRQRDHGAQAGLTPKRRGRKGKPKNPLADEVARLQRKNNRLEKKLRQAELIIDVQKKVSEILGIPMPNEDGLDE
jgi:transposase